MTRRANWLVGIGIALAGGALGPFVGCSGDDVATGPGGTAASAASGGSAAAGGGVAAGGAVGGGTAGGAVGGATSSTCGGHVYECCDDEDNDDDGLIDAFDPDCTGPCDNTEDSLYPDLPGMTGAACQLDCFWDNGNGAGNDECYWDHHCDPLEVDPDYHPEGEDCAFDDTVDVGPFTCDEAFAGQTQQCYDYCIPLVPNGCDCFGCCELPAESGNFVWLQSYDENKNGTCTLDAVEDPELCQPCTVVPGCENPCGHCELCMGKTELPPDCYGSDAGTGGSGGGYIQCEPPLQPCGLPDQDPCPAGEYCITGCCRPVPT